MYKINDTHLYEVFDDYICAKTKEEKSDVVRRFCSSLWKVPNQNTMITKTISYRITRHIPDDFFNVFDKYKTINYNTYKSFTNNTNSWHILRQKINNIYNRMCNPKYCTKKDYLDSLSMPKTLYYRYINGTTDLGAKEIQNEIESSILKANELYEKYANQKLKMTWGEYKDFVNDCMLKCFENFIPLDEYETKDKIVLDIDFWNEDNFIISYIGKSINGYMKNYQKKYYGLPGHKEYTRCSCGGLFVQNETNRIRTCNQCNKRYKPKGAKIIKCVDCGIEFEINSNTKQHLRCAECYNKYRRKYKSSHELKRFHNKLN